MGKLNNRKLRRILRELDKECGQSARQIAKQYGITGRWARGLRVKYAGIPISDVQLKRRGRKSIPISAQEVIIVHTAKERYDSGAVTLQNILAENGT